MKNIIIKTGGICAYPFKKLNKKFKDMQIVKIAKLKKENKILREKVAADVIKEHEYIDKMNLMQGEIRDLKLKGEPYEKSS